MTNIHFNQNQVYYRNEYIQRIINVINNTQFKLLEVYGQPGVGKSTVVAAAAGYLNERHFFLDGIILLQFDPNMEMYEQIAKYVDPSIKSE